MPWFIINKQVVDSKVGSRRLRLKGPSGQAYIFEVGKPLEVTDPQDAAYFADPANISIPTPYGVSIPQIIEWEPEGPEGEAVAAAVNESERLREEVDSLKSELAELKQLLVQALSQDGPAKKSSSSRSRRGGTRSAKDTGSASKKESGQESDTATQST